MLKKINVIGLLAAAVMFYGCVKKAPQTSSSPTNLNSETKQKENENVNLENKKVKLQTSMGDIIIEMQSQAAPNTVKNFLQYVESGFYNGIIFHRVMRGFMIQTGGFNAQMEQKQPNAPIKNEFKISNTRGTVAMAKLGGNPDSATCQFFISVADNSYNLDKQNGGFTVFGKVVEGMDVVDKIASVKVADIRIGASNALMESVPVEPIAIKSATIVSQ